MRILISIIIFILILLIAWFDSFIIPNVFLRLFFNFLMGSIGGFFIAKIHLKVTWKEVYRVYTFSLLKKWKRMSKCDECWIDRDKLRNAGTCGCCMEDPEFWYILNRKELPEGIKMDWTESRKNLKSLSDSEKEEIRLMADSVAKEIEKEEENNGG